MDNTSKEFLDKCLKYYTKNKKSLITFKSDSNYPKNKLEDIVFDLECYGYIKDSKPISSGYQFNLTDRALQLLKSS